MKVQGNVREQIQGHFEKRVWNPHRLVSEKDFERNLYLIVSTYLRMKGEGKKYTASVPNLIEHVEVEEEVKEENDEIEVVDDLVPVPKMVSV